MCIFSQPVDDVSRTRIFARQTSSAIQFLVYQMQYESAQFNAMIVPVPVKQPVHNRSLQFINLERYNGFFDDLEKGFPFVSPQHISIGCSGPHDPRIVQRLNVFTVGSYVASFVPTVADFSRLDERFQLPQAIAQVDSRYRNFGFAVFQLREGSFQPHPMAFKFEAQGSQLFFPTLHVHDGSIRPEEDFDHMLYMQHAGFDSKVYGYQNYDTLDPATNLVRSQSRARQFCKCDDTEGIVDGGLLVHKKRISGKHANQDTTIPLSGDPERPGFNLRPLLDYVGVLPWVVFWSAVYWVVQRRNQLKREVTDSRKPTSLSH